MNEVWEPSFLADFESELAKHEKIATKNQRALLKNVEQYWNTLIHRLDSTQWDRHQAECLATAKRLMREKETLELKLQKAEEVVAEMTRESNSLASQISDKKYNVLVAAQELDDLKVKMNSAENDIENERKEVTQKHQAILITKDEYKKSLGCHIRLLKSDASGSVYIFTFESIVLGDVNAMPKNSVKLSQSCSDGHWQLLQINPTLPNFKQLSHKLQETQDVRGLLCYVRNAFNS